MSYWFVGGRALTQGTAALNDLFLQMTVPSLEESILISMADRLPRAQVHLSGW